MRLLVPTFFDFESLMKVFIEFFFCEISEVVDFHLEVLVFLVVLVYIYQILLESRESVVQFLLCEI